MSNRVVAIRQTPKRQSTGNTNDFKSDGRRIYISGISKNTTIEDIYKFFGPKENIEGVFIDHGYGFVTFKRPKDFSWALTKNGENFLGCRIAVTPYDRSRSKSRRLSPARFMEETRRESRRERKMICNSTRTRSRSRSSSLRFGGRSRSQSLERSTGSRSNTQQQDNYLQPSRLQVAPSGISNTFANYSLDFQSNQQGRATAQEWGPNQQMMPASGVIGDLPSDIDLTLKLVIAQQTAKNLSISQCQNVVLYFDSTIRALQGMVGVSTSGMHSFQQQTFPSTYAHPTITPQIPQNVNTGATDMDDLVDNGQSLDDIVRKIREMKRK